MAGRGVVKIEAVWFDDPMPVLGDAAKQRQAIHLILLTMMSIAVMLAAGLGVLVLAAMRRRRRRREAAQRQAVGREGGTPAVVDAWAVAGQRAEAEPEGVSSDPIHDELTGLGFSDEDAEDLEAMLYAESQPAAPGGPAEGDPEPPEDPELKEDIPFGDPDDDEDEGDDEPPFDDGYPDGDEDDDEEDDDEDNDSWWQRGEPPPY